MILNIGWSMREMSQRLMPEKSAAWLEAECLRRCRLLALGRHWRWVDIGLGSTFGGGQDRADKTAGERAELAGCGI
jgi:hypothetical protein